MNKIKFLGHASIYIETPKVKIVTDPWFSKTGAFLHSWFQFPDNTEIDFDWVKTLDYVCLSHEHQDHYDIEFLKTLPDSTKIVIPKYDDNFLYTSLKNNLPNEVIELYSRTSLTMGDVVYTPVRQSVPGWNDCTLMFETPMGTIADVNDMKVSEKDLKFIEKNFDIDYLFIQYSGASWHPQVYSIYDKETKIKLAKKKVYIKFKNVLNIYEALNPKYIVPCAGPPCFLDDDWFYLNLAEENSFPDQKDFYEYFVKKCDKDKIIIPLPGNRVDGSTHIFNKTVLAHPAFSDKKEYLKQYKERRKDIINSKLGEIQNFKGSLLKKCQDYFVPLIKSSEFLTERINNKIMLITEREKIVVDFRKYGRVYGIANPELEITIPFYTFKIESKYLNMIFDGKLTWEELFLSLRFEVSRTPDKYNEFLMVFLKFADPLYFKHYELHYYKTQRKDTFELEVYDKKYRVQKYCSHALGDLSKGTVLDGNLICPIHAWTFSLKDGHCINHDSEIFIEEIVGC